ncbi:TPA: hypothetical protein NK048_005091 [Vibrio parahaemolyticus]|nr:hypothetical protein [Vibrio parahaemolyticus]HCH5920533.1 hypothetical protein [Vibrio parahaemolyticus]
MKLVQLLVLNLLVLGSIGCSGVKFSPAEVNEPIPETFSKRALYPAGVSGYEFQDLVGNILAVKSSKDPIRIGLIRPKTYENSVIPITNPNNYYRSRIQKGAEAQGSYLAFAGKFSADQMAELVLIDIARAGVVFDDAATWKEIQEAASRWVVKNPKTDPSIKRLWVKSVVLSRRLYSSHTKIDANATGQVGEVTGVKSGVYRKSENEIKSVMLGFEAFDIDELAQQSSSAGFIEVSKEEILESSRFTGVIKGNIDISMPNI